MTTEELAGAIESVEQSVAELGYRVSENKDRLKVELREGLKLLEWDIDGLKRDIRDIESRLSRVENATRY